MQMHNGTYEDMSNNNVETETLSVVCPLRNGTNSNYRVVVDADNNEEYRMNAAYQTCVHSTGDGTGASYLPSAHSAPQFLHE